VRGGPSANGIGGGPLTPGGGPRKGGGGGGPW